MQMLFNKDAVDEPLRQSVDPASASDIHLVRLLRMICHHHRITLDDFAQRYQQFGCRSGWTKEFTRTRFGNDRRFITSSTKLTFFLFTRIIYSVLCLDVVGFAVVVRDPRTGVCKTFNSSDPVA
jgi:hypothetical protein